MRVIARAALFLTVAALAAACGATLPAIVNGSQICFTDVDGAIQVTEHIPPLTGGVLLVRAVDAGRAP